MNTTTETARPASNLEKLVKGVFSAWRQRSIKFVILRNYGSMPQQVDGDIDLLVAPEQLGLTERTLVEFARANQWELHNRVEFMPVSLFLFHRETKEQIQFDLFHELRWRGFRYFDTRQVLDKAIERGGFWIPHPAYEAVNNLMTRQIYHGYVKAEYKPTISAGFRDYPTEVRTVLSEMFGDRIENKLSGGVNADAWSEVEAQTWAMRRALVWRAVSRRPMATLATLWADLRRLTGRLRHPPGLTVVLLGPDGSGKSTVAKAVQVSLSSTFKVDKSLVLHWKPIVFFRRRRLGGPPTTNPHGSKPRNGLGSLAALGFHWLEYFLGGMLEILPVRFRNGLVLFDRYFYDFEVDPRRFRLALPWHWPLRMFRALPAPDLIFLLDVSPETMLARKQEVSLAELQRQREAFRSVVSRLPNGTILPSERPIESVVSDMAQSILEHLRNRQAQRMEFELTNPDSA